MSAAAGNLFTDTFNSANPNSARVTVTRTAGAASLTCDNLAGWPTVSKVHFSTYTIDTNSRKVAGTQIDWQGIVSGNTIGTMTRLAGATDAGNSIGQIVEMMPTGSWGHDLYTGLTAQHNQDGTHAAVTASSVSATGVINATAVSSLQDASTPLSTYRTDYAFDFVQSGMVWSGLGYGSTLTAAMTSGVVYINGQRLAISAVATRTFTASKDTYIDVLNTAGVGSLVYTEVANNAASPALAANSVRIGIVVSGANIAAATSINQGQETMVLPIASSVPYTVSDSLGNLICPRDPNRKVLCYRQSTAVSTSSTTATQIPPLSCPVIVPTGRKVKITIFTPQLASATAGFGAAIQIWDGVVGSGTQLAAGQITSSTGGYTHNTMASVIATPTTASKTYNGGLGNTGGSTVTSTASATSPAFMLVELA